MNKKDYLDIKENFNHYQVYYKATSLWILIIIALPFLLNFAEIFSGKQFMNDIILLILYILAILLFINMRSILRNNNNTKRFLYYKSFRHIADNHFKKEELEFVMDQYNKNYAVFAHEVDDHIQIKFQRIMLNIYTKEMTEEELIECIKPKSYTVVNLFIADKFTEELKDTIIYYVPEGAKQLILNIGYEKQNKHFFFCANDIYNVNRIDKARLKLMMKNLLRK